MRVSNLRLGHGEHQVAEKCQRCSQPNGMSVELGTRRFRAIQQVVNQSLGSRNHLVHAPRLIDESSDRLDVTTGTECLTRPSQDNTRVSASSAASMNSLISSSSSGRRSHSGQLIVAYSACPSRCRTSTSQLEKSIGSLQFRVARYDVSAYYIAV